MLRLLATLLAFSAAAVMGAVALQNIGPELKGREMVETARFVESYGEVRAPNLWLVPVDLDMAGLAATCFDALSRANLTIRLTELALDARSEASPDIMERARLALDAADQRLKCSPRDGNAWLQRARILDFIKADPGRIEAALRHSFEFTAADQWVLWPRVWFTVGWIERRHRDLLPQFAADIGKLVHNLDDFNVSELYYKMSLTGRDVAATAIMAEDPARIQRLMRAIDGQGVTFHAPHDGRNDHGLL